MPSLSVVLRLAGILSATSTPTAVTTTTSTAPLYPSARNLRQSLSALSTVGMSAPAAFVVSRTSAVTVPVAFPRARLIRARPGFVPASFTTSAATSTSSWRTASTCRIDCGGRRYGGIFHVTGSTASSAFVPKVQDSRWFTHEATTTGPGLRSGAMRPSRRLFSAASPAADPAPAEVSYGRGADEGGAATLEAGHMGEGEEEQLDEEPDDSAPFKVNLLEMDDQEVEDFLKGMGEPKFRAKQVLKWMYDGGAASFDDMNNIPKALREKLAKVATVGVLEVAAKQTSKDGTKKLAYRLADGQVIESVLMPYSDGRRTACISSQVGCAMGCVFCATGQMGFKRQLSSAEIFEQAYHFSQELNARGDRLSNVVFMGMGEPLANYKNVIEAVKRINVELGIGARHITISTVGLVPRIVRLSQEGIQVKLAVSLHAANDRERSALLPVNQRFPLSELMDSCREYVDASGRRMTFEWALIQGKNDSPEIAAELGRLLRPLKGMCHVNIIPLNPTAGYKGGPSMADAVNQFVDVLARQGVPATPRTRRGIDIDAGCGQLTVKVNQDDVLGRGL